MFKAMLLFSVSFDTEIQIFSCINLKFYVDLCVREFAFLQCDGINKKSCAFTLRWSRAAWVSTLLIVAASTIARSMRFGPWVWAAWRLAVAWRRSLLISTLIVWTVAIAAIISWIDKLKIIKKCLLYIWVTTFTCLVEQLLAGVHYRHRFDFDHVCECRLASYCQ